MGEALKVLLPLLLLPLLTHVLATSAPTAQDYDSASESHPLRFGRKLMRSTPKKLEVHLQLPQQEEIEQEVAVSSTQTPRGKTKRGRVPSKIMVRTFKTTTPEPPQTYYPQEESETSTTTEQPSPASRFNYYYNNQYVSRKPSIPPKKFFRSSTTPSPYTFPPYNFKDNLEEEQVKERKPVVTQKKRYYSQLKTTTTYFPPTTTPTTTTTTEEYTTYPNYEPNYEQNTEVIAETTFETSPPTEGTTTPPQEAEISTKSPIRVFTKTFKPVIKTLDENYEEPGNTETSVKEETGSTDTPLVESTTTSTEGAPPSTTSKKVHYIITVIDPPTATSNSTINNQPQNQQEEEYEEEEEEEVVEKENKPEDPYANFRTLEFTSSSFNQNSPSYDFIPSVSNSLRSSPTFPLLPPLPHSRSVESRPFQSNLLPLASYTPDENSRGSSVKSSFPFLTSRTVLYYTSVSPASKNSSPSANSLIPSESSPFANLPSAVSDAALGNDPRPRFTLLRDFNNRDLNQVAAQSYYLDQRRDLGEEERGLRTIPVRVDYVPN